MDYFNRVTMAEYHRHELMRQAEQKRLVKEAVQATEAARPRRNPVLRAFAAVSLALIARRLA